MSRLFFLVACLAASLFTLESAQAGVGKISSPEVKKNEFEVEYSGIRTSDDSASGNNKQSHTLEMEYGFTDRLMLGLETKEERSAASGSKLSGYGIEGQYQFTKQGDWWLASAIKAEYLHAAHDADADEAEAKLLLARTEHKFKTIVNISLERELGSHRDPGVALSSAVQATYACDKHFTPGIEWHGDYGMLNDLNRSGAREHYVGPILTGELFELGSGEIGYTAGYYWGLTGHSTDHAARLQIGYETAF